MVDFEAIIEQLRGLEKERAELLQQPLAPEGAWIHHYTKKRVYPSGFVGWYQYAKWQANEPIFERKPKQSRKRRHERELGINQSLVKHQHIGRMWSSTGLGCEPEVIEAFESWNCRKKLEAIDRALEKITALLSKVSAAAPDLSALPEPPELPEQLAGSRNIFEP